MTPGELMTKYMEMTESDSLIAGAEIVIMAAILTFVIFGILWFIHLVWSRK
jgi:hypothetical protein